MRRGKLRKQGRLIKISISIRVENGISSGRRRNFGAMHSHHLAPHRTNLQSTSNSKISNVVVGRGCRVPNLRVVLPKPLTHTHAGEITGRIT